MPDFEEEFLQRLIAAFRIEAAEHVQELSSGLLDLEKATGDEARQTGIEYVFREAHSLKGAARAVNRHDIESVCQYLEEVFAGWKKASGEFSPEVFDVLLQTVETLDRLLQTDPSESRPLVLESIEQLAGLRDTGAKSAGSPPPSAPAGQPPLAGQSAPVRQPRAEAAPVPVRQPAQEPGSPAIPAPATSAPIISANPSEPITPATIVRQQSIAQVDPTSGAARLERQPAAETVRAETIRIGLAKLDSLLLEAEEMLAVKLAVRQRSADLRGLDDLLQGWRKRWTKLQPALRVLRAASGEAAAGYREVIDFLAWSDAHWSELSKGVGALCKASAQDQRALSGMVDSLLEDTKRLLMLPFSTLLGVLPKMVRELAREEGKEIELELVGGDVEIDKRILDEMKDPLIHLVRNSIDHGIETPASRAERAKPVRATLRVAVAQTRGSEVELLVQDDGGGIDVARLKESALRHGRITGEEAAALSDTAAMELIFQSEISTSPILTEISGRGLGMAIVREKVEHLGGRIHVDTSRGRGTTFRIFLPLTVATFRGILVRCGDFSFVIPTVQVERIVRFRPEEIRCVESQETINFDGRPIAVVPLSSVLGLAVGPTSAAGRTLAGGRPPAGGNPTAPRRQTEQRSMDRPEFMTAAVLGATDRRIAFTLDEVLDEQEVLVKNLGRMLPRVRNISGATILGTGQVVPILNVGDLVKSAIAKAGTVSIATPEAAPLERPKTVLIAEDSITSRMLLKNILESAGYQVKTAVDGQEALNAFTGEEFDLIVSDVDMPRLNGFDLVERIRGGDRHADVPVVLVTARGSREDRERGIDVGANAYIVKTSFDQSDLLEMVGRLI